MFGDTLNRDECEAIVRALRLTQMPFACAHGRPTCAPLARVPNRATLERGDHMRRSRREPSRRRLSSRRRLTLERVIDRVSPSRAS